MHKWQRKRLQVQDKQEKTESLRTQHRHKIIIYKIRVRYRCRKRTNLNSVENPVHNLFQEKKLKLHRKPQINTKNSKTWVFSLKLKEKTFSQEKKNFHLPITNPNIPFFQPKRSKQETNKYKNKNYASHSHMISASSTNQRGNPKRHFGLSHFWVIRFLTNHTISILTRL